MPQPAKFIHIDPNGNKRCEFNDSDNQLISQAKASGAPSVRIGDVRLPSGHVLTFEVRFQPCETPNTRLCFCVGR